MNLPAESIAALKGFGYTQREAEFLYIVAAHSGFFLQRHFTQFVDVAGREQPISSRRPLISSM